MGGLSCCTHDAPLLSPCSHPPAVVPQTARPQALTGGLGDIYRKLAGFCELLGLPAAGKRSLTNARLLAVVGDAFFTLGCAEKTTLPCRAIPGEGEREGDE